MTPGLSPNRAQCVYSLDERKSKGWKQDSVAAFQKRRPECCYVVYIYPVEPNLCGVYVVTDSILGEYMVDAKTSLFCSWLGDLKGEDLQRCPAFTLE